MNVLILNLILSTAEKGVITRRPTNANTMIYTMARGFVELGHEVTLVSVDEFRPLEEPEHNDFEVVYFKSALPRIFKSDKLPLAKGLKRWLRLNRDRFDVVISSEVFSMATLAAMRVAPEKVLCWQEMNLYQRFMGGIPAKLWYKVVTPLLMKNVRVAARSESAREFVSRFCPNVSSLICNHGADGKIFYPGDSAEARDAFVIVARLVPGKNISHMLDVYADFVRMPGRGHWMLDICGDGPQRAELEVHVRHLGIEGNVTFHGYCTHAQWTPIARTAKGMLIDTLLDLNMVTVSESLCNGTPVLMNSLPATATLVRESGAGIVRDNWTAADLARMADNYPEYARAAANIASTLTNTACARALLSARTR